MTIETPKFFSDRKKLRSWFEKNHAEVDEQWIGYFKTSSGKPSITWPESVEEALCFGWIDGLRKSIDDDRYKIRFTPRRPGSHWSAKNLDSMAALLAAELVHDAGRRVFETRKPGNERQAAHEQRRRLALPRGFAAAIRANRAAWTYWRAATLSYRKQVTWWIVSAKKDDTRQRRLAILIDSSANGEMVPPFRWTKKDQ